MLAGGMAAANRCQILVIRSAVRVLPARLPGTPVWSDRRLTFEDVIVSNISWGVQVLRRNAWTLLLGGGQCREFTWKAKR